MGVEFFKKNMKIRYYTLVKILLSLLVSQIIGCSTSNNKPPRKKMYKSEKLAKYEKRRRAKRKKRKKKNIAAKQATKKNKNMEAEKNSRELAIIEARKREQVRDECFKHFHNVITVLQDLKDQSGRDQLLPPYSYGISYTAKDCEVHSMAKNLVRNVKHIRQRHSNQVGLLVPTVGHYSAIGKEIIAGAKSSCSEKSCSFDEKIVTRHVGQNLTETKKSLADLIFDFNVSIIVGGTSPSEVEYLNKLSLALKIPVLLLNSFGKDFQNDNIFKISPSSKFMAITILKGMKKSNLKNLAILNPRGQSKSLNEYIKQYAPEYDVTLVQKESYSPHNFDSMKIAASNLLQVTGSDRNEELKKMASEAKAVAESEGKEFDPEKVHLPAKTNFDLVLIPDNFKVVRHFLKLFKFHGVKKVPLIGNHLWRSPDIIEPWDPMLEGAVFADFVGNYKQLPESLGIKIGGKGLFVNPDKMASIDYRLLGYRSMSLALEVSKFPDQRRFKFSKQLSSMYYKDGFFENGKVFDNMHQGSWPTYLFNISNGRVRLKRNTL